MTAAPGENPPLTGTHRECCPRSPLLRRAHERRKVMSQQPTVVIDGVTYVPAPPIEEAPAPEPVARWTGMFGESCGFIAYDEDTLIPLDVVDRACDALNTLDANGVAWGPGRPMSELPDDGLVLVQMSSGVPYTFYIRKADYIATHRNTYECWWPLPEVTP